MSEFTRGYIVRGNCRNYFNYYKCHECMKDAPYIFCCKCYCGEYEFCRNCKAKSRGTECPNSELLRSENHD